MNKFYFRIVYDSSKKNKIKVDIGKVGLLVIFNKKLKVFGCKFHTYFGGNILVLKTPIEYSFFFFFF